MKEYEYPILGIKRLVTAKKIALEGFPAGTFVDGVYYGHLTSEQIKIAMAGHKKGIEEYKKLNQKINGRTVTKKGEESTVVRLK